MTVTVSRAAAVMLLGAACCLLCPRSAPAETIRIDDFDSRRPQNLLGGAFGVWGKDPGDASQWCKMSFDAKEKIGQKGSSLKLEYSVESKQEAYNGLWMKL